MKHQLGGQLRNLFDRVNVISRGEMEVISNAGVKRSAIIIYITRVPSP